MHIKTLEWILSIAMCSVPKVTHQICTKTISFDGIAATDFSLILCLAFYFNICSQISHNTRTHVHRTRTCTITHQQKNIIQNITWLQNLCSLNSKPADTTEWILSKLTMGTWKKNNTWTNNNNNNPINFKRKTHSENRISLCTFETEKLLYRQIWNYKNRNLRLNQRNACRTVWRRKRKTKQNKWHMVYDKRIRIVQRKLYI